MPVLPDPVVPVYNASGEVVPGFALMRRAGVDSQGRITVGKPDADGQLVLVNGPGAIPPASAGQGSYGVRQVIAFDPADGTPALNEVWGAGAGSWYARKDCDGFAIDGGAGGGAVNAVRVSPVPVVPGGPTAWACEGGGYTWFTAGGLPPPVDDTVCLGRFTPSAGGAYLLFGQVVGSVNLSVPTTAFLQTWVEQDASEITPRYTVTQYEATSVTGNVGTGGTAAFVWPVTLVADEPVYLYARLLNSGGGGTVTGSLGYVPLASGTTTLCETCAGGSGSGPPVLTYDCVDGLCVPAEGGEYATFEECLAACEETPSPYDCVGGECVEAVDGAYPNLGACLAACTPLYDVCCEADNPGIAAETLCAAVSDKTGDCSCMPDTLEFAPADPTAGIDMLWRHELFDTCGDEDAGVLALGCGDTPYAGSLDGWVVVGGGDTNGTFETVSVQCDPFEVVVDVTITEGVCLGSFRLTFTIGACP